MFTFNEGISESEALSKFKASRNTDSQEQPEKPDVVNVSEDAPTESEEAETQVEALTDEVEESAIAEAEEVETEAQEDAQDLLYYDIDGEEVSSKQLKEWKSNGLMQADYTRKTQELSQERKAFEEKEQAYNDKSAKLESMLAEVQAIIDDETPSAETLAEWREYEPEKLLDYQEKSARRKELINKAKEVKPEPVQHDYSGLLKSNPDWVKDGQTTDAYTKDMQAMTEYANSVGMSTEEAAQLSPQHLQILLDATRYSKANAKSAVTAKKVRKAPISTKPKAQQQSSVKSEIEALQARVKKYGREQDFVKLRKLQRQLNN
jgi:hypothetical protein